MGTPVLGETNMTGSGTVTTGAGGVTVEGGPATEGAAGTATIAPGGVALTVGACFAGFAGSVGRFNELPSATVTGADTWPVLGLV